MRYLKGDSASELFNDALVHLMTGEEKSARGLATREVSPMLLHLTNPKSNIVNVGCRKTKRDYADAELYWYLSGRNDSKFISKYAPFWNSIADKDGLNNSAYGYWMFNEENGVNGKTQWQHIHDLLSVDRGTRKAVVYLGATKNYLEKDTICTNTLQFMVTNGRLDMHVNMRSNDIVWGFCNDVVMFTMFQQILAYNLGLTVGQYYHYAASFHIYEKDYPLFIKNKHLKSDEYVQDVLELPYMLEFDGEPKIDWDKVFIKTVCLDGI